MVNNFFKNEVLSKTVESIIGKSERFTVDQQLLNLSLVIIGISYLFTIIQNPLTSLPFIITVTNFIVTVIIALLYYLSRYKQKSKYSPIILITSIFISFSIDWFPNGGVNGPMPVFYLALLTYIIFLLTGLKQKLFLFLFLLNILILFILEYYRPEWVVAYKKRWIKYEDLFTGYIFCAISLISVVYVSKQLYLQERKNTIDLIEQYRINSQNLNKTYSEKKNLLSPREQEIFKLIIEGKTNKEIASQLFIEERTVKNHITSIYKKIEVKRRSELFANP